MKDYSQERTFAENDEQLQKSKLVTGPILLVSYIVSGFLLFKWAGWLGILLAIPVGMIIGIILGGIVTRIIYTKK